MHNRLRLWLATAAAVFVSALFTVANATSPETCGPQDFDRAALEALKADDFETATASDETVARSLVGCLGNTDPFFRDDIGYGGLTILLRSGRLPEKSVIELLESVSELLAATDEQGFRQPFAALVLSEVARADRVTPMFSDAQRTDLVAAAVGYVGSLRDYRGFDDSVGWRHGVAHGADLLMQLTLNPNIDDRSVVTMVDAALSQVPARDRHAYVFGEPERLARPVLFAAQRGALSDAQWRERFEALVKPNGQDWEDAYGSTESLARLHNTRAFLHSVYARVAEVEAKEFQTFKSIVREALKALP